MATDAVAGVTFDDDQPIVLAGDPRRLRGTMVVRNPGSGPVVLRRLRLHDGAAPAGARARTAVPAGARLPTVRLPPGAVTSVPLRLRVDPATPPGEYAHEVEIAGQRRQVVLQVSERVDLRIRPRVLVIPNLPGTRTRKPVAFANAGNVAITVPEFLVAVLDDERLDCRVLRRALAEIDAETATFEGYLDQLVRSGKATLAETGHVGIRVEGGAVEVAPGATVPVTMELQVPERVDRHSRYTSVVPIATTDLTVIVAPFGAPVEGPPPREPEPSEGEPKATARKATAKKATARTSTGTRSAASKRSPRKASGQKRSSSRPRRDQAGSRDDEE